MKKKKVIIILIAIIIVSALSINYTYSKLNITFTQKATLTSKVYKPISFSNSTRMGGNTYSISIKNENNYEVIFSCDDTSDKFDINCSIDRIPASTTLNVIVDLDFKENVDFNTLPTHPSGNGYLVKFGLRVTYPYAYIKKEDVHYEYLEDMIIENLPGNNLADYIINLSKTDTTNLRGHTVTSYVKNDAGAIVGEKYSYDFLYVGESPKNYIYFNNELWRILGIYGSKKTDGHYDSSTGEYVPTSYSDGYVKIMKLSPYNNIFYDGSASGTNSNFKSAKIKTELNETFYYSLSPKYRKMNVESNWNVGGLNSLAMPGGGNNGAFGFEHSDVYSAKAGLISPTDYVFATGGSNAYNCTMNMNINNISTCSSANWLYPYVKATPMWTISEYTASSGQVLVVNSLGNIEPKQIIYPSNAYPAIYLDKNVEFIAGNGSASSPFKLKTNFKPSTTPVLPTYYEDYITDVYLNSWGNSIEGFAGTVITSFDRNDGAALFDNDTWGISSEYTIDQVTVYSYQWAELATYYQRDWEEDNGWHARKSDYVFKRQVNPDLEYIGSDTLTQRDGTLRFLIIVKPKS